MSLNYKLFNFFFLAANRLQTFNLKILKILVGVAGFELIILNSNLLSVYTNSSNN